MKIFLNFILKEVGEIPKGGESVCVGVGVGSGVWCLANAPTTREVSAVSRNSQLFS